AGSTLAVQQQQAIEAQQVSPVAENRARQDSEETRAADIVAIQPTSTDATTTNRAQTDVAETLGAAAQLNDGTNTPMLDSDLAIAATEAPSLETFSTAGDLAEEALEMEEAVAEADFLAAETDDVMDDMAAGASFDAESADEGDMEIAAPAAPPSVGMAAEAAGPPADSAIDRAETSEQDGMAAIADEADAVAADEAVVPSPIATSPPPTTIPPTATVAPTATAISTATTPPEAVAQVPTPQPTSTPQRIAAEQPTIQPQVLFGVGLVAIGITLLIIGIGTLTTWRRNRGGTSNV
ncbi:MAG: hypothetical protein AAF125_16240, partial [Chloroflexota bacterium]